MTKSWRSRTATGRRAACGVLHIDFWNLDFDGVKLGRCKQDFVLKPFDGERLVTKLEICPCGIYDMADGGALRQGLLARGQK